MPEKETPSSERTEEAAPEKPSIRGKWSKAPATIDSKKREKFYAIALSHGITRRNGESEVAFIARVTEELQRKLTKDASLQTLFDLPRMPDATLRAMSNLLIAWTNGPPDWNVVGNIRTLTLRVGLSFEVNMQRLAERCMELKNCRGTLITLHTMNTFGPKTGIEELRELLANVGMDENADLVPKGWVETRIEMQQRAHAFGVKELKRPLLSNFEYEAELQRVDKAIMQATNDAVMLHTAEINKVEDYKKTIDDFRKGFAK